MHGTRSKESLYRREFLNLAGLVPVGWAASSLANLWADGTVIGEGSYVDGKKHGHWIMRFVLEDECVMEEGLYVHGKKHGHWVRRWSWWTGPYGKVPMWTTRSTATGSSAELTGPCTSSPTWTESWSPPSGGSNGSSLGRPSAAALGS